MTWIQDYFIGPILNNGWFNPVNTITYGIVLVIAVYLVFKLLKKMKIHIDRKFTLAVLPFIFWGSTTRVLHDAAYYGVLKGSLGSFYSSPLFPTPGSYLITFLLALLVLLFSLTAQRFLKIKYWKLMFVVGIILDIVNIFLIPFKYFYPLLIILGVTGLWALLFFLLTRFSERMNLKKLKKIFTLENSGLLSTHMLDASATWAAMTFFGYLEQHPLPRFLIGLTNPVAMFPLKLVVLIPVLYLIDKHTEPGDFRNFLKIVILILGLAPGLRDMIRLMVGV